MSAAPSRGEAGGPVALAPEAELTRALYERHAPHVYRYCLHQLGSREEAEDAVQSTFLNAFRGIKRGTVPESDTAWLFKIAHNVCLTRRRSSWRRGRVESPADFELVEEVAAAPPRWADELIGFRDVLERMPARQRRAILLREWQGLSYSEIAGELALSQSAVETLIFRARRSLAEGLDEPARPRRLASGALGSFLTAAQSFLAGGGAVKVAAVVAAAGAGGVAASVPVRDRHAPPPPPVPRLQKPPAAAEAPTPVVPAAAPARPARPHPRSKTVHHVPGHATVRHVPPGLASKPATRPPGPAKTPAVQPRRAKKVATPPVQRAKVNGRATAPGRLKQARNAEGPPRGGPSDGGDGHGAGPRASRQPSRP